MIDRELADIIVDVADDRVIGHFESVALDIESDLAWHPLNPTRRSTHC